MFNPFLYKKIRKKKNEDPGFFIIFPEYGFIHSGYKKISGLLRPKLQYSTAPDPQFSVIQMTGIGVKMNLT